MQATVQHPQFISVGELAEAHGMEPKVLRRRIRRWGVQTYEDPYDLRRVLVRREDAEGLFQPRKIRVEGGESIAA